MTGKVNVPGSQSRYLMPFACSQCGECCSHLGLVHIIQEDLGGFRFIVRNQYTGERTGVRVDPDKVILYQDTSIFAERPEACPFFRYVRAEEKGYCTVHLTRPEICRDYGCWRMLILDSAGRRAGRIMEQRHLASESSELSRIFAEKIDPVIEPDDAAWDKRVTRVLREAGYTVRM